MEWFIQHLSQLSPLQAYGWLAGILLLCGLGLPIPEDLSLIAAGYFAHRGVLNVHKAFAVCWGAVLLGDTCAFLMGRWFGQRVLAGRLARRYFTPRKQRRVRAYFRKFGTRVVFLGRFMPGLRFAIYFSGGMLQLRPAVFIIYDSLAAAISVPVLVYLAWYFGDKIDRVISYARHTEHGILIVVVVGVGIMVVKALLRRRRRLLAAIEGGEACL